MNIRKANNNDSRAIYELHIASIKHFCSDFYSKDAISAWVNSKSLRAYENIHGHDTLIVAEESKQIVGFGLLNSHKKSVDSLYIAPQYAGKGYGKVLLIHIENIAKNQKIDELSLSSTLNAIAFYHHMGYEGNVKSVHKLSSGVKLDCIIMSKKIEH